MATPRTRLARGAWCAEPELSLFSASRSLRLGIGSPVRDAAIWLVGAARVRRSSAGPCLRVPNAQRSGGPAGPGRLQSALPRTRTCVPLATSLNFAHEVVSHRPLELVSETPHQFLLAVGEKSALSPGQTVSHHYRDDVVPIEGARRCWTPPDGSAVAAHNGRCDRLVESGARGRVFVVGHRRARIGTLIVDRGPHARTDRQR
jgi:hypothetical protein